MQTTGLAPAPTSQADEIRKEVCITSVLGWNLYFETNITCEM